MLLFRSGSTRNPYRIPLLIWIVLIFFVSTDRFSGTASSRIIGPLLAYLFPGLAPSEIVFWHSVLRKLGHVAGYFVLGFLSVRGLSSPGLRPRAIRVRAVGLVLAVALSDEYHQSFSAVRSGSIVDVGYDCLGGFSAVALLLRPHETRSLLPHSVL